MRAVSRSFQRLHLAISKAGRNFPLIFFSPKRDGQCNTQTAVSLLTFKLALRIALIYFSFSVSSLGKLSEIPTFRNQMRVKCELNFSEWANQVFVGV